MLVEIGAAVCSNQRAWDALTKLASAAQSIEGARGFGHTELERAHPPASACRYDDRVARSSPNLLIQGSLAYEVQHAWFRAWLPATAVTLTAAEPGRIWTTD
ncbi:uncharacterized protein PAN0_001c0586 [Moesziomyces antarcticus]|uniref:Uncharacterized protein n=1 Tax=Pseudozyma antarctica TaxID=84753 RepID=A0A5C3FHC7_PSEA2|nr:uncharacterized protein PAN0_001c0586 [Moesziomyces antarcticus]GAK62386.1 hypothetical protein PAN0_001c0586 [Moesziomyces antarcticus]SPO42931.1 uncharacterized protein PSANT_00615 [Moesziomyces antarcticus]